MRGITCASLRSRQAERCYWFSDRVGVLPAFGAFTGMQAVRPAAGERVFVATPEQVFELGWVARAKPR